MAKCIHIVAFICIATRTYIGGIATCGTCRHRHYRFVLVIMLRHTWLRGFLPVGIFRTAVRTFAVHIVVISDGNHSAFANLHTTLTDSVASIAFGSTGCVTGILGVVHTCVIGGILLTVFRIAVRANRLCHTGCSTASMGTHIGSLAGIADVVAVGSCIGMLTGRRNYAAFCNGYTAFTDSVAGVARSTAGCFCGVFSVVRASVVGGIKITFGCATMDTCLRCRAGGITPTMATYRLLLDITVFIDIRCFRTTTDLIFENAVPRKDREVFLPNFLSPNLVGLVFLQEISHLAGGKLFNSPRFCSSSYISITNTLTTGSIQIVAICHKIANLIPAYNTANIFITRHSAGAIAVFYLTVVAVQSCHTANIVLTNDCARAIAIVYRSILIVTNHTANIIFTVNRACIIAVTCFTIHFVPSHYAAGVFCSSNRSGIIAVTRRTIPRHAACVGISIYSANVIAVTWRTIARNSANI